MWQCVLGGDSGVRILSADLQQVHTVVPYEVHADPWGFAQLPDGRVLVGNWDFGFYSGVGSRESDPLEGNICAASAQLAS